MRALASTHQQKRAFARNEIRAGEARSLVTHTEVADLVIASYMIGEIGDCRAESLAELMRAKTRDTLLVVEPGTPAGYARSLRSASD